MEKKISQLLEAMSTKKGQLLVGSFILLSVINFSIFVLWDIAAKPFSDVRHHAIAVARNYADLQSVKDFSIYNGRETYFSLQGATSKGESIAVIISEETNTVHIYPLAKGISKSQAQAIAQKMEQEKESVQFLVIEMASLFGKSNLERPII